jgi:hypothetical protein
VKQVARDSSDRLNGDKECGFVRSRWLVEATHLAHELQGGRADLFFGDRRVEIEKDLDISAHVRCLEVLMPPDD